MIINCELHKQLFLIVLRNILVAVVWRQCTCERYCVAHSVGFTVFQPAHSQCAKNREMKARHLEMKQNICFESLMSCTYKYIHVSIHVKNNLEGIHIYKYTVIPSISYTYMRRFPCGIIHTEESLYVTLVGNFFTFLLLLLALITIAHHGWKKKCQVFNLVWKSPRKKKKSNWSRVCFLICACPLQRHRT